LIRNFVDSKPEFVFLPRATEWEKIDNGTVFDVPNCELGHHGEDVSFTSFLKKYNLTQPALVLLGEIVRAADSRIVYDALYAECKRRMELRLSLK
jgi:hypothetical protein